MIMEDTLDNGNTSKDVLLSSESSTKGDEKPFTIKEEHEDIFLSLKNENNDEFENLNLNKKDVLNDFIIKDEHNKIDEDDFTLCRSTVKYKNCINIVDIKGEDTCNQEIGTTEINDNQHAEKQLKSELPIITKELVVKLTRCIITGNIKEENIVGKNIDNNITDCVSSEFDAPDAPSGECENSIKLISGLECYVEQNKTIQGGCKSNRKFKCSICSISFFKKPTLKVHILSHTADMFITQADNIETFIDNNYTEDLRKKIDVQNLYCNVCKRSSQSIWTFLQHLEIHSNSKKFICNVCNKSFARYRDLKQHLPLHDRGIAEYVIKNNMLVRRVLGRYKCDICGLRKGDRHMLATHMLSHTQEVLLTKADNMQSWIQNNLPKDMMQYIDKDNRTCHKCNKTFSSESTFVSHLLLHSNIKRYTCNNCDKSFTNKAYLSLHLVSHSDMREYTCDICHKSFKSKNCIRKHLKYYCKEKDYVCKFCRKSFETEAELSYHDALCHTPSTVMDPLKNDLLASQNEDKKYICGVCDKRIVSKNHIQMHLKIHDKSNTYFCNFCDKSFSSKLKISRHLVVHSDMKKYVCTVCGKMFKRSNDLKNHSVIHSSNKSIVCSICNKTLKHRLSLRNHLLMHEGTKNHKCTTCGKLFRQSGHLSTHMLTHKNVKNYSCSICGRLFTRNISLTRHILLHYNIKNFACDICKKLFTQKGHLTSHLARIHNIKI